MKHAMWMWPLAALASVRRPLRAGSGRPERLKCVPALMFAGGLAACAGARERKPPETVAHAAPAQPTAPSEATCFTGVPGAHVAIAELSDGIEMTYSADVVGDVSALRAVVRELAARQNEAHAVNGGPGDVELRPGDAISPPVTALLAPAARATVTDTPLGARLTVGPVTPEARTLLRAALHAREAPPSSGVCPPDVRLSPDAAPHAAQ